MAKEIVIGLDAGHGLPDPGASKFIKEYLVALQLVLKTKKYLEAQGVKVLLTRTSDKSLSTKTGVSANKNDDLDKRVDIINKTDFTVSFHLNAGGGTGYETLGYNTKNPKVVGFHNDVAAFFKSEGFKDRGIKSSKQGHLGGVAVIDEPKPVVVLGEFLFVDTKKDADVISNEAFQERLCKVIAKSAMEQVGLTYKESVKPAATKPATKPVTTTDSFTNKKLKSKVDDLNFYSKPSWDIKDRAGVVDKGIGFPTIVKKIKVDTAYQYEVKNSKGATYYITASSTYVTLENK